MDGVGALAWVLPGALAIASFLLLTRWLRNSASRVRVPERGEATTIEEDALIARVDQNSSPWIESASTSRKPLGTHLERRSTGS